MKRPRVLAAFTAEERKKAHSLLARRVAYMMGRKMEEGDWADVYCSAKGIENKGWSNLKIDVMHDLLGIEHKMICYRSNINLAEACGQTFMHPSATRSIRVPSTTTDANEAMRDVLTQYGDLIKARREVVRAQSSSSGEPDMRTGWLLWQQSLRQFLYFEEEMLVPEPNDYKAEWVSRKASGARKQSTNLWIYERETERKRYSVTTEAGAKIQPYFDVPTPSDPNLYLFTVIGEVIDTGLIRVWITESTARELRRQLGSLDTDVVSRAIGEAAAIIASEDSQEQIESEVALPILITSQAYETLQNYLPGVSDEHSFQLLAQHLRHEDD